MKNLLLLLALLITSYVSSGQTYNPTNFTISNKAYGIAQAAPTDARSYFYDASLFIQRPYQSTAEVLSYLNLTKYRVGQFPIYISSGTLQSGGTFTGGTITEYWFKDGTANNNLVIKQGSTYSDAQAISATQNRLYGNIYNRSTWANISDFTNRGATVSIVGGKLRFTGGNSDILQSLDIAKYTNIERWKMSARVILSSSGVSFGLGMRGASSGNLMNMLGNFNAGTGNISAVVNVNTFAATTATGTTFSVNDTVLFTVERNVELLTVSVQNLTTDSPIISTSYTYDLTGSPLVQNTGRFGIFSLSGTFSVDSLAVSSNEIKNADVMFVGDSKIQGFIVPDFAGRASSIIQKYFPSVVNVGGGGDQTNDIINRLDEIIFLQPKQVILSIGSNDARTGGAPSNYLAKYDTITARLTRAGIEVIHLLPINEDLTATLSSDQIPMYNHIKAVYSNYIDTWTSSKNCVSCIAPDGLHPNAKGQQDIANTIIQSYKLKGLTLLVSANRTPVTSTNSLPFYELANSGAGSGVTTSPFNPAIHSVFGSSTDGLVFSHSTSKSTNYISSVAPGVAWRHLAFNTGGTVFAYQSGATAGTDSLLVVDNSGVTVNNKNLLVNTKIGVGVTPTNALDVNGILTASGLIQSGQYMTSPLGYYNTAGAGTGMNNALGSNTISFRTNGVDNRLSIDAAGKVNVLGVLNSDSYFTSPGGFYTSAFVSAGLNSNIATNILSFRAGGVDNRFIIDSTGNIFIAQQLTVGKTASPGNVIINGYENTASLNAGAYASLLINSYRVSNSGADIALGTNATGGYLQMRHPTLDGYSYNFSINPLGGSVGIGTSAPNSSAVLELGGVNGGFLLNRVTTTERDAITTPAEGLQVYNLTTHNINFWNGTVWKAIITD